MVKEGSELGRRACGKGSELRGRTSGLAEEGGGVGWANPVSKFTT